MNKIKAFEEVHKIYDKCQKCDLHLLPYKKVISNNNINGKIMLIGEAPGQTEQNVGIPFVGKSGGLLRFTLINNGFKASDLLITNTVACWPGIGNPKPSEKQIEKCFDRVLMLTMIIEPKVIIAVGKIAYETILKYFDNDLDYITFQNMEGDIIKIKLYKIYHPSYILRDNSKKNDWIEKIKKIYKEVNHEI